MPYDAENFSTVRLLDVDPKTITDPKERLMYLRDFLRQLPPDRFDMNRFAYAGEGVDYISAERVRTDCGTTACVAGWCVALFTDDADIDGSWRARDLLALSDEQSSILFYANAWDPEDEERPTYWGATPQDAANVLEHLIQTGEVDWSKA